MTVRDVQRELSITTVYVTHNQAEALAVSDCVAVMHDGRVEQVAALETVYREPASGFVAEFVGDNNLLDAEVTGTDPPRASVDGVDIRLPSRPRSPPASGSPLCPPGSLHLGPGETTLEATVAMSEFLGDAYRVHCDWEGRTLLMKTDDREAPEGSVRPDFRAEDVHLLRE